MSVPLASAKSVMFVMSWRSRDLTIFSTSVLPRPSPCIPKRQHSNGAVCWAPQEATTRMLATSAQGLLLLLRTTIDMSEANFLIAEAPVAQHCCFCRERPFTCQRPNFFVAEVPVTQHCVCSPAGFMADASCLAGHRCSADAHNACPVQNRIEIGCLC